MQVQINLSLFFLIIIIIFTNGNYWLYLVICIICELMGYCAIK